MSVAYFIQTLNVLGMIQITSILNMTNVSKEVEYITIVSYYIT